MDGKIKAQRYPTEHFTSPRVQLHLPVPGHTWLNHAPRRSRFDWALASTLAGSPTATTAPGGILPPYSTSDGHCKPTPPPAINVANRQIWLPNGRFRLFAWFLSSRLLVQWSPKKYSALSDFLLSITRALRHTLRLARHSCTSWNLFPFDDLWE